jgi:hypothetical protein
MIPVSKPWLPSFEEMAEKLQIPWSSGILTHNGPLVQEFERRLEELWGVKNVIAVSNGTMAIQLAIRALKVRGEIITSPFTWHATATAIKWEGCAVKFSDICEQNLCLDPTKVESAISEKTGAIMPVNVYGNPPDFVAFEKISEEFGIPIIYDAAHSASTTIKGKSTLANGSVSATSFHATKFIHTGEGGACITEDDEIAERIRSLRFFGFRPDGEIGEYGTNAKMTEIHAAIGLCCLDNHEYLISKRARLRDKYEEILRDIDWIQIRLENSEDFGGNNLYFPISLPTEEEVIRVMKKMGSENIFPRRYFYPSLNTIKAFDERECPISEDISSRIICLPLFVDLENNDIERICSLLI